MGGRVRPPLGLQLSLFRLVETVVWQFMPDFIGGLVLGLSLSDFGSASCLWLGYIGFAIYLMLISHDIIVSKKHHKVSHMRRVVKMLRVYNFVHLSIQCIYLLVQAMWNKECMRELGTSVCACNTTVSGSCCVDIAGTCVRSESYADSLEASGAASLAAVVATAAAAFSSFSRFLREKRKSSGLGSNSAAAAEPCWRRTATACWRRTATAVAGPGVADAATSVAAFAAAFVVAFSLLVDSDGATLHLKR